MIYRLLSYVIFGLLWPLWWLQPKLRGGTTLRWGDYRGRPRPWPPGNGPRVWLHGASAGDVRSLRPVVRALRDLHPDGTLVLSVITNTGFTVAQSELSSMVDGITYAPLDLPWTARRAVRALRPDVVVLEYAEIWPNLLAAAQGEGARIVLGNGRLHPDRMAGYRWLEWLAGAPLTRIDRLLMRSQEDADRAAALGVPADRIEVTGNTKFDDLDGAPEHTRALEAFAPAPWLVAGSTHPEDETALIDAFSVLRRVDPEARMIVAPRYPERAEGVARRLARAGWVVQRWPDGDEEPPADPSVVVINTVGHLRALYRRARLAVVGGSFGDRGGHNVLEPAAVGVPVLAGPDLSNAADAVELLRGRGLIQVIDGPTLARVIVDLWFDAPLRRRLAERAAAAVREAQGAAARNASVIAHLATLKIP